MEPQDINEYLQKLLPSTIALLITAFVSVVIGVYLEKFKGRIAYLKYNLMFNPIATTIQNDLWGNIEVLYEGRATKHVNLVTIRVLNDSNIDLEDVNLDVWVDQESQILGVDGNYVESGNSIYLEQTYDNHFTQTVQRNLEDAQKRANDPDHVTPKQLQRDLRWILTNKRFYLPILNRHTSIRINLLVENFVGETPRVRVSILHKSVNLITQEDKSAEEKKLGLNVIGWGIILFLTGAWFVHKSFPESSVPILLITLIGVFYLFFGFLAYRFVKFVKHLLA